MNGGDSGKEGKGRKSGGLKRGNEGDKDEWGIQLEGGKREREEVY